MIRQWMTDNLHNSSIIVEAGTCDGSDTLWFARHCTNGMVYGFEPIPALYNTSLAAVDSISNVELYNKALSHKTGSATIFVSDRHGSDWGSSSLLKPKDHLFVHPDISFNSEINVDTINLDEWILSKKLSYIDLMWLDMQGSEPIVLMNAPLALDITKFIYTEVSLIETYDDVILYPEYKKFLIDNQFEIVFEDLPWRDMGNVLFRKK